jgi:hypothetical protein
MLWLHPDTAISYNNIGLDINSKGDFDAALVEFRKALAIREVALTRDHPGMDTFGKWSWTRITHL